MTAASYELEAAERAFGARPAEAGSSGATEGETGRRAGGGASLVRGLLVIGVILALAIALPAIAIEQKRDELQAELARRLEILATGRAEIVSTWLDSIVRPAERVAESELFRLFATEMDLSGGDLSDGDPPEPAAEEDAAAPGLGVPLTAQIPFMEQVLADFVAESDYLAGQLIGRGGQVYVASPGAREPSPEQFAAADRVFESAAVAFGTLRESVVGLVLDLYVPVPRAQSELAASGPAAVLMLAAPMSAALGQALQPPALAEPGERLALVEGGTEPPLRVAPGEAPPLSPTAALGRLAPDARVPFALRPAVSGEALVYSVGAPVRGPRWWILQEVEQAVAESRLDGFRATVIALAALTVIAVATAFGAFWWRQNHAHSADLAEQYRRLAARIEAQKRLLDGITDSITDHIGLKAPDGSYRYVNPAFARALGRSVEQTVGLDDRALFGAGTAERLRRADQRALATGAPVTTQEEVHIGERRHHLQIRKVPVPDGAGRPAGIVSVARDVTELVEEQARRDKALRQLVAALVRAVELRDPYLAGHSRRLAGFAGAVARRLEAPAETVATVEIAAELSQIGKLAVPREILGKPDRLTNDEVAEMRRHVEHAATVLREVDFALPVAEAVAQMHERLDGTGYPKGLAGEAIGLPGRILGACDVFCARVEPRAYRAGIAPAAALEILETNPGRYDPAVVAALKAVVHSVAGEKLLAGLQ